MNKFNNIPVSFKLSGQNINVETVEHIDDGNTLGKCSIFRGEVLISNRLRLLDVSNDSKINTFYHELIHLILDQYGYDNLSENEKFVEQLSSYIYNYFINKDDKYNSIINGVEIKINYSSTYNFKNDCDYYTVYDSDIYVKHDEGNGEFVKADVVNINIYKAIVKLSLTFMNDENKNNTNLINIIARALYEFEKTVKY